MSQMAAELEERGRDYIVLERNAGAGSFFRTFPRHRRLISANKVCVCGGGVGTSLLMDNRAAHRSANPPPSSSHHKRYTGDHNYEFNLRHDWNSLLSNDSTLLMREFSKDYFPHADALADYFQHFADRLSWFGERLLRLSRRNHS